MTVEYNKGTACPILLSTKESAVALTMDSAKKLQADLAKVIEQAEKEPEPTEFELALRNAMSDTVALSEDREDYEVSEICDKQAKRYSADLITTAKQQLLQSGELMTQEHHEKLMETLREECKKDLPRWRKCPENYHYAFVYNCAKREDSLLYYNGHTLMLIGLEKLPGFKEDK